jgi:hypothetical protein
VVDRCDLGAVLDRPQADAIRALKKFPAIGEPGAEKILLFAGKAPILALESNGLRSPAAPRIRDRPHPNVRCAPAMAGPQSRFSVPPHVEPAKAGGPGQTRVTLIQTLAVERRAQRASLSGVSASVAEQLGRTRSSFFAEETQTQDGALSIGDRQPWGRHPRSARSRVH